VKGFLVLIGMLAVIGAAIAGVGYYLYGDRFIDMVTVAEARVKAAALQAGELANEAVDAVDQGIDNLPVEAPGDNAPHTAIDTVENAPRVEVTEQAQPAPEEPRPAFAPEPVRFSDPQGRFSALFPGKVGAFENYLVNTAPDKIGNSRTFAASGREIVAQVTVLSWAPEFLPAAKGFAADIAVDPADTVFGETGKQLTTMLLGEGSAIEAVREFDAFDRRSVELTGMVPNGEGGFHRSVVWLMPGEADMIAVILRAYDDSGLLGIEAQAFNENFAILEPAAAEPAPAQ
tara:strand:+ start:2799 stop:3662 length:864 start_codon:yes stop_codon:yes gene_type:complete